MRACGVTKRADDRGPYHSPGIPHPEGQPRGNELKYANRRTHRDFQLLGVSDN